MGNFGREQMQQHGCEMRKPDLLNYLIRNRKAGSATRRWQDKQAFAEWRIMEFRGGLNQP